MPIQNKKILFVIAPTGFKDDEFFIPYGALKKQGAEAKIASLNTGRAKSEKGQEVEVDFAVDEIKARDYDAVAFIGGPGMVGLVNEPSFVDLARDFYEAGKLVTAICIAPVILAKAGILEGRRATVTPGSVMDLEDAGAECSGEPVTVTENIITASGPAAAGDFAKAIIKAIS